MSSTATPRRFRFWRVKTTNLFSSGFYVPVDHGVKVGDKVKIISEKYNGEYECYNVTNAYGYSLLNLGGKTPDKYLPFIGDDFGLIEFGTSTGSVDGPLLTLQGIKAIPAGGIPYTAVGTYLDKEIFTYKPGGYWSKDGN